jgi:hypothetical protein
MANFLGEKTNFLGEAFVNGCNRFLGETNILHGEHGKLV